MTSSFLENVKNYLFCVFGIKTINSDEGSIDISDTVCQENVEI